MPENIDVLEAIISNATTPDFRDRIVSKGEARSMIWNDGVLPEDAPNFGALLSYDLLSYGYALLSLGLRLVEANGSRDIAKRAFEYAATAIESVLDEGATEEPQSFHRIVAAASFQIGSFSARSYSLLNNPVLTIDATVSELSLVHLLRRDMESLAAQVQEVHETDQTEDKELLKRLQDPSVSQNRNDHDIEVLELVELVLTENFIGAMNKALLAFERGDQILMRAALIDLHIGLRASQELHLIRQWWIHKLAIHLLDGLWETSLHKILPVIPDDDGGGSWNQLRRAFIAILFKRGRSEIDLWPSQLEAARQSADTSQNLVLSLPTSAGKTRIAELCILAALAESRRVVFITPLRALSAQTEVSLRRTFGPLGKIVSSLYGPTGITGDDSNALQNSHIVVSTPEKFDFALRENPNVLDDVGLVVLDEGHMIGPNEREVRYEVLLQRILNRDDAGGRRIVCLSAILPSGEAVEDFAGWLTHDQQEGLITSTWRPTKLRYGEVVWEQTHARLNFFVDGVETFIPRFLEPKAPSTGRRMALFPRNQMEMTLATAWKLLELGKSVLIYCAEKRSVNALAKQVVELAEKGLIDRSLTPDPRKIAAAIAHGEEWLPNEHPILECLRLGVVVHHGSLPSSFRNELENLLRDGILRVTISSPTLAQGLNLSASALVVHSIWRYKEMISESEFRNIVGRAGRAFVDSMGLIVHPIFEEEPKALARKRSNWAKIVYRSEQRNMDSGILRLVMQLIGEMKRKFPASDNDELVNYVAGIASWDELEVSNRAENESEDFSMQLESQIASLDCAILGLIGEFPVEEENLDAVLDEVLASSLWSRSIARAEANNRELLRNALSSRAHVIWKRTTSAQRRGYFLAGVGFQTGQELDRHASLLESRMWQANYAILEGDQESAVEALVDFARTIFTIEPFSPKKLPTSWEDILVCWLKGLDVASLEVEDSSDPMDFIEEGLVYRLSWALEAVRARARAHDGDPVDIRGSSNEARLAATAVQTGTLSRTASLLVQLGFSSRLGAVAAAAEMGGSISDRYEMFKRLQSSELQELINKISWPTADSHELWVEFVNKFEVDVENDWSEVSLSIPVTWEKSFKPSPDIPYQARTGESGKTTLELTDGRRVGTLSLRINPMRQGVLSVTGKSDNGAVNLTYIGPKDLFQFVSM